MYLITDRFPPFDLGAPDYAVAVVLPPRGRLNRAAVLFRVVLAVPALILGTLVCAGLQLPLFFIWLIILISGRMPSSVFEAEATVLRYQARVYSWLLMLPSVYPGGLFGDPPLAAAPTTPGLDGLTLTAPAPAMPEATLAPPPPAPGHPPGEERGEPPGHRREEGDRPEQEEVQHVRDDQDGPERNGEATYLPWPLHAQPNWWRSCDPGCLHVTPSIQPVLARSVDGTVGLHRDAPQGRLAPSDRLSGPAYTSDRYPTPQSEPASPRLAVRRAGLVSAGLATRRSCDGAHGAATGARSACPGVPTLGGDGWRLGWVVSVSETAVVRRSRRHRPPELVRPSLVRWSSRRGDRSEHLVRRLEAEVSGKPPTRAWVMPGHRLGARPSSGGHGRIHGITKALRRHQDRPFPRDRFPSHV